DVSSLEHARPERQESQRPRIFVAPERTSAEASPDDADRVVVQPLDRCLFPPVWLEQAHAFAAHPENALQAFVDAQKIGVLVESGRVLEPGGAAQPVAQLDTERAQAAGDGAGAAAADAEHDDRTRLRRRGSRNGTAGAHQRLWHGRALG